MNDLATFQRELDALETGLPDAPDMARIRRGGRLVRRRRRLVQGVGVAAAATTAVALSLGAARQLPTPSFFGSATNGSAGGEYVTLDAPGWTAVYVSDEPALREVQYQKDGAEVDITEYPASQYASYVADRQDVGDGQSLEVLGVSATTWAYAADDHTAIRSPEGGYFIEVRGTGMDAVSYRSLVAQLALTGASEFAQAMPKGTVTPANHDAAIQRLLQGVDLPPGFTAADVDLKGFNDRYQASARVAGQVGCAWLDVYAGGSAADGRAAIAAFDASRHWPLLLDIEKDGGYSSDFWSMADRLRALDAGTSNTSVADLRQGIC
jgi:hypothetical protein